MTKTILFGALPPPLGGVSVYCQRRLTLLKKEGSLLFFADSKKLKDLLKVLFVIYRLSVVNIFNKKEVIQIELNSSSPFILLFFLFSGLTQFTYFIDHNGSRRYRSNKLSRIFFKYFILTTKKVGVVNNDLLGFYKEIGAYDENKFLLTSPFLPPDDTEFSVATSNYDVCLQELLQTTGRNIVMVSAWRPIDSVIEPDLYGLIPSLQIYKNLISQYKDYFFVIMIGEFADNKLSKDILSYCEDLKKFSNFIMVTGGKAQWPLLSKTQILLRLTKTDGDSVSVREALHYGATVIASDVCTRPEGVVTVSYQNIESLTKLISTHLSGRGFS